MTRSLTGANGPGPDSPSNVGGEEQDLQSMGPLLGTGGPKRD
jgi:hypothetical protein